MLPGPFRKLPNSAQDGHLGAIMAHLVPNLLPTWSILASSYAPLRQKSPPNRARNLKKRPQTHQDHPEDCQRAPGQPWGSNFDGFGVDFGIIFQVFPSVSPSILHGHAFPSPNRLHRPLLGRAGGIRRKPHKFEPFLFAPKI